MHEENKGQENPPTASPFQLLLDTFKAKEDGTLPGNVLALARIYQAIGHSGTLTICNEPPLQKYKLGEYLMHGGRIRFDLHNLNEQETALFRNYIFASAEGSGIEERATATHRPAARTIGGGPAEGKSPRGAEGLSACWYLQRKILQCLGINLEPWMHSAINLPIGGEGNTFTPASPDIQSQNLADDTPEENKDNPNEAAHLLPPEEITITANGQHGHLYVYDNNDRFIMVGIEAAAPLLSNPRTGEAHGTDGKSGEWSPFMAEKIDKLHERLPPSNINSEEASRERLAADNLGDLLPVTNPKSKLNWAKVVVDQNFVRNLFLQPAQQEEKKEEEKNNSNFSKTITTCADDIGLIKNMLQAPPHGAIPCNTLPDLMSRQQRMEKYVAYNHIVTKDTPLRYIYVPTGLLLISSIGLLIAALSTTTTLLSKKEKISLAALIISAANVLLAAYFTTKTFQQEKRANKLRKEYNTSLENGNNNNYIELPVEEASLHFLKSAKTQGIGTALLLIQLIASIVNYCSLPKDHQPNPSPSTTPTLAPSAAAPTGAPTGGGAPTGAPSTATPTKTPTSSPTTATPTDAPSTKPTSRPTEPPTFAPPAFQFVLTNANIVVGQLYTFTGNQFLQTVGNPHLVTNVAWSTDPSGTFASNNPTLIQVNGNTATCSAKSTADCHTLGALSVSYNTPSGSTTPYPVTVAIGDLTGHNYATGQVGSFVVGGFRGEAINNPANNTVDAGRVLSENDQRSRAMTEYRIPIAVVLAGIGTGIGLGYVGIRLMKSMPATATRERLCRTLDNHLCEPLKRNIQSIGSRFGLFARDPAQIPLTNKILKQATTGDHPYEKNTAHHPGKKISPA